MPRRHAARLYNAQAVPFRGLDLQLCNVGCRPRAPRLTPRLKALGRRPPPHNQLLQYHIPDMQAGPLEFCVDLGVLLDCLRTFSGEASPSRPHSLHLTFRSHPSPSLSLRLVEGISVNECTVAAIDVEPPYRPPAPSSVPVRVVWSAALLRDAIQTLETLESGDKERGMRVHVQHLSPKQVLKLTVSSPSMGAELSYPQPTFICFDANADVDFTFRFSRVARALRALKHTSDQHVLMRLSSCGRLHLMLKFTGATGVESYVEWQLDALDDLIDEDIDGEAKMRSETPAHQPQGSKRALDADLQGARSGATRLDTPAASMNRDAGSGSGPATDRVRRRLEEAWY